MSRVDQLEEMRLKMDRNLFRDGGKIAGVGDERCLLGFKGRRIDIDVAGEIVTHRGAIESLGVIELVAGL